MIMLRSDNALKHSYPLVNNNACTASCKLLPIDFYRCWLKEWISGKFYLLLKGSRIFSYGFSAVLHVVIFTRYSNKLGHLLSRVRALTLRAQ